MFSPRSRIKEVSILFFNTYAPLTFIQGRRVTTTFVVRRTYHVRRSRTYHICIKQIYHVAQQHIILLRSKRQKSLSHSPSANISHRPKADISCAKHISHLPKANISFSIILPPSYLKRMTRIIYSRHSFSSSTQTRLFPAPS